MAAPRRVRMRLELASPPPRPTTDGLRNVGTAGADDERLAALMDDAYRGTIDAEPDLSPAVARREIGKTLGGDYGLFVPEASFLVERGGLAAAAGLVTLWHGEPLLAYLMTRRGQQRRGLARAVFWAGVGGLLGLGHRHLNLAVTVENAAAFALYRSLGFAEYPPPP